jgi:hypothetical protein
MRDLRVEFVGGPNDGASAPYRPEDQLAIGKALEARTGPIEALLEPGRYVVREMRGTTAIAHWEPEPK